MRDAGRDQHAGVGVLAGFGLAEIEDLGGAVRCAADAQVVQHDARPPERHVPVVGLVQVVVQPDDAARGAIGAVRLDHLAPARDPLPAERLDEQPALVAVHRGDDVEHAGDDRALGDRCHRASLLQIGSGMVAEHQSGRLGALAAAHDLDLAPEE